MKNWLSAILLYCLTSGFIYPQHSNLKFEQYTVIEGLPSDRVHVIFKDSYGFMWFGTSDGLSRYDGNSFVNYKRQPGDSNSLFNNRINAIYEDSRKNLWVGTNYGLHKMDRKTEKFTRYVNIEGREDWLSNNGIMAITGDKDGIIWIGTLGGGLNRYDPVRNTFRNYRYQQDNPNGIGQDYISCLYVDNDNILWLGLSGSGLDSFDQETEIFTHHIFGVWEDYSRANGIREIHEDGDSLWISSYGGLTVFDKKSGKYVGHFEHDSEDPGSLSNSSVHNTQRDLTGNLWVATHEGLNYFNPNTGKVTAYWKKDPGAMDGLKDDVIFDMLYDPNGSIWLGTQDGGVLRGHLGTKAFVTNHEDGALSAIGKHITDIKIFKNRDIWITTTRGIAKYNHSSRSFSSLNKYLRIPELRYKRIIEDRRGDIWACSDDNGVIRFNAGSIGVTHYTYSLTDSNSLGWDVVSDIMEDHLGNVWVATFAGGLSRYEDTDSFVRYRNKRDDSLSISSDFVTSLFLDRNNTFWIGTMLGLNRFNYEDQSFIRYLDNAEIAEHGISISFINDIHQDKEGFLWAGTRGGLVKYNDQGEMLELYTEREGLPYTEVWSVLTDQDDNIWIGTGNGLCKFDRNTKKIRVYDVSDGLPSNKFIWRADAILPDGTILLGTPNGLVSFHPKNIKDNMVPPPVVITGFNVHENESNVSSRNVHDKVKLKYHENVFDITYAALNYNISWKNQFAYKMEGFDEDWTAVGNRQFVTYTNLDPGNYTFRVKGSNNDGVWNEDGASLQLEILPPPWKTWWAYVLYTIGFVGMIWTFIYYRVKQERLKADLRLEHLELEKMKDVDSIKTKFFANVSHELRTPLTLILGPLKDIAGKKGKSVLDPNMFSIMYRNGQKLLALINQLLDVSKLESGKTNLRVSENDLIKFTRIMFANFTSLAEDRGIEYNFNHSSEKIMLHFDAEQLEKVLNNLLSNAMKFTGLGGKIDVTVSRDEKYAILEVKDSGIGIPKGEIDNIFGRFYQVDDSRTKKYQGTGIGLSLAKELIDLHHGEIEVDSREGEGSTFIVRLLLGKAHFSTAELTDPSGIPENDMPRPFVADASMELQNEIEEDSSVVMIVEDNADMRTYVKHILSGKHKIIEAEDGKKGFDLAINTVPDLIISDVMMPEMDGYEFCKILKADMRTSHIPVIMLTAKAADKHKLAGLETGADAYLIKPFNVEELLIRIAKLIEQRRKLQEKFSRSFGEETSGTTKIEGLSADEKFIKNALQVVEENLSDACFDIERFRKEMGLSRVQLYRKIKALTGFSPNEFVRNVRLKRAAKLLVENNGTIAEIAYEVGFNNLSYFSKCFKEEFHKTPSEYMVKANRDPIRM